jgi:Protein of unknown function (DUF3014)
MASAKLKDPILPILIILALGGGIAAFYYWIQGERDAAQQQQQAATEAQPEPAPQIRYPLQSAEGETAPKPLPPLAESDPAMQEAAADLIGQETFERLFNVKNIARRVVVTIDNLPRKKPAQRYTLAKPVAGQFATTGKDENIYIDPANYKRYTPYIALVDSVDTKKLVGVYTYFYPLLQEEYENLGYPNKYLNDRMVEVIDDLLAAPDIKTRIQVVRPKVLFEYADPNLEALSSGQKVMLRMGSENSARVKAKLQEIRLALTEAR